MKIVKSADSFDIKNPEDFKPLGFAGMWVSAMMREILETAKTGRIKVIVEHIDENSNHG